MQEESYPVYKKNPTRIHNKLLYKRRPTDFAIG